MLWHVLCRGFGGSVWMCQAWHEPPPPPPVPTHTVKLFMQIIKSVALHNTNNSCITLKMNQSHVGIIIPGSLIIFPGFITQWESSVRLMSAISPTPSGPNSSLRRSILPRPMPCSPVQVPPVTRALLSYDQGERMWTDSLPQQCNNITYCG